MPTYEFRITLGGVDHKAPLFEDPFYEAGCDDGMLGVIGSTVYIEFVREAESAEVAVTSAIGNVTAAGAKVIAVSEATVTRET